MDFLLAIFLSIPISMFFLAIIMHEPIIERVGKFLCSKGRHSFKKKKFYCKRCKKPRNWPILTCIQGDKKDKPIFPRL